MQLTTINVALAQWDVRCGEIYSQQDAIEDDIRKRFRQLHQMLDARETEVTDQLHQLTQDKLSRLSAQRDQIETTQARLFSCIGFIKESINTRKRAEALKMKRAVVEQVDELTTTFTPDLLELGTKAGMIFSAPDDFITACRNYGEVSEEVTALSE